MAPPAILTDRERCAIVLLGHGSREQQANLDFALLAQSLRAAWPKHHLIHAYVELARPSLAEALAQAATLCNRVVVLPCFLFAAGHIKNDLPHRRDYAVIGASEAWHVVKSPRCGWAL